MDISTPGITNNCPNALQGASAQLFLTLINALMAAKCKFGPDGRYPPDYGPYLKDKDEFDFIVVGGGTAGSVVASRLSENAQWNVLLLEAGGYASASSEIPTLFLNVVDTDEDWRYTMEPSKTCCMSFKNNSCRCPKGKGLGGSSLINGMSYARSIKYDHDGWASNGNDGWDHDSIVKHYKKIENVDGGDASSPYGTSGELHLTLHTGNDPLRLTLMEAYKELGFKQVTEKNPIGFRDNLIGIYQGTRQNTAKAFLAPAKKRKNLHVVVNATVDKLLVNDNKKTVIGVELTLNNKRLKIQARKEVIVSAGSVNSPQILMRSGIGPKEHLSELGIEVIKNLRVGDNFHDHFAFPALAVSLDKSAFPPEPPGDVLDELYQLFKHGKIDMSKFDVANFGLYANTQNQTSFANVQYLTMLIPQQFDMVVQAIMRYFGQPESVTKSLQDHNKHAPLLLFVPILLVPKSRGFVRLQNADPLSKPAIIPNCLSDEHGEDIEVMLDSVKLAKEVIQTKAFAKYNPKIVNIAIENCRSFEPLSDDYWKCSIRNVGFSAYHHVGTCKMGPESDVTAVVDQRLRIHGLKNVRVIDASVMPNLCINPYGPTIMVGDKGAEMVKEDWLSARAEF